MRILIAPDKFKGCLTAAQVAESIARGILCADPLAQIDRCPVADGGEGTVAAMVSATGGTLVREVVTGPLPTMKVRATFGFLGDGHTAVIEMAEASGLHLLRADQLDPLATTSFGTGELITHAARRGAKRIIIGIGGSATCDAGIGCAQACGVSFQLSGDGSDGPILCGRDLDRVLAVKPGDGSVLRDVMLIAATDVTNPLSGPTGAACVYGPQKGASPAVVRQLDECLAGLASRLGHRSAAAEAGAGAAGGLGFGLRIFLKASLVSGFQLIAGQIDLRQRIAAADLVITGEGKLDSQSASGKAAFGVATLSAEIGRPSVAVAGIAEERSMLFASVHSVRDLSASLEDSMTRASELLTRIAEKNYQVWTHLVTRS